MNRSEFENTANYAFAADEADPLSHFRQEFYIPIMHGKECIYFTGNSLGLQPKSTQEYVLEELEDWASFGVEGHFHARNPWKAYHEMFPPLLTELTGAKETELVVMNSLTTNLHLLMASFYRPTTTRFKILCEGKAFPSDQYAFKSQIALAGFDPNQALIEVNPREGEVCLRTEDILETIAREKDTIALVLFSGVNYYTGQVFDMKAIAAAAHQAGAYCGFDLAHAIGNIHLQLHDWEVDFATWCSYKYLNSGPGGVSGIYIHEKYATDTKFPRLAGWWGQDKDTRFLMEPDFNPIPTAEGWQLSNAPVLSMAAHKAALDLVAAAGVKNIFAKGQQLQQYLCFIIDEINEKCTNGKIKIITPRIPGEHGCQVSMVFSEKGKQIFEGLTKNGILADWREPDVIRIAPVAMYNSFTDIFQFGRILEQVLAQV